MILGESLADKLEWGMGAFHTPLWFRLFGVLIGHCWVVRVIERASMVGYFCSLNVLI
jgi:hypothetical protein